jgi:ribonuclease III
MDLVYSRPVGPHWADVLIAESTLTWLNGCLGQKPHSLDLYVRALTHGSTGYPDYQRLEFLGDRILGLVIAEMLYTRYPDEAEGRLSHRLNSLVAGLTCAAVARNIDLPQHINLGKQAKDDGAQESDKVLGDVVESIIGALYLDHGLDAARSFIIKHWTEQIEAASGVPKHPKSALQEWCAANNKKMPEYVVTNKEGPPHAIQFEVTVTVKGLASASANANSKQAAETAAALHFLELNT